MAGATAAVALTLAAMSPGAGASEVNWTTWGFDMQRTGYNPHETVLSPSTVAGLKLRWARGLYAPILTQPLVLTGVSTTQGALDLVYVGTLGGRLYALNAANGTVVWMTQLGRSQTGCSDFAASNDVVGIIGTPSIDPASGRLYVASGDGLLHALDVASGAEVAGWPLHFLPAGLSPARNVVYGSPTLDGHLLYIETASTCDVTPYAGEVIAVNLPGIFVTRQFFPDGSAHGPSGGGIWGPGGVSLDPSRSSIYAATGNAVTTPYNQDYSEHVLQLNTALTLIASDGPAIPEFDSDFGATPLPYQPAGCPAQLAVMNKNGILYIYDRSAIGSGAVQTLQISQASDKGNFIGLPAFDPVLNRLYLGNSTDSADGTYLHGLIALGVNPDCSLGLAWQQQVGLTNLSYDNPVIPPVLAGGVAYYAEGQASQVAAFDEGSGAALWSTGSTIAGGTLASPTVANGMLFVSGYNHVIYAYGL